MITKRAWNDRYQRIHNAKTELVDAYNHLIDELSGVFRNKNVFVSKSEVNQYARVQML